MYLSPKGDQAPDSLDNDSDLNLKLLYFLTAIFYSLFLLNIFINFSGSYSGGCKAKREH